MTCFINVLLRRQLELYSHKNLSDHSISKAVKSIYHIIFDPNCETSEKFESNTPTTNSYVCI